MGLLYSRFRSNAVDINNDCKETIINAYDDLDKILGFEFDQIKKYPFSSLWCMCSILREHSLNNEKRDPFQYAEIWKTIERIYDDLLFYNTSNNIGLIEFIVNVRDEFDAYKPLDPGFMIIRGRMKEGIFKNLQTGDICPLTSIANYPTKEYHKDEKGNMLHYWPLDYYIVIYALEYLGKYSVYKEILDLPGDKLKSMIKKNVKSIDIKKMILEEARKCSEYIRTDIFKELIRATDKDVARTFKDNAGIDFKEYLAKMIDDILNYPVCLREDFWCDYRYDLETLSVEYDNGEKIIDLDISITDRYI